MTVAAIAEDQARRTRDFHVHRSASAREERTSEKIRSLLRQEIAFIHNREFEHLSYEEIERTCQAEDLYVSSETGPTEHVRHLPPYLATLYTLPLLTAEGERALFRKLNYLKYCANSFRASLDPQRPNEELKDEIEILLKQAEATRNQIIEANLRLVVSIARKFAADQASFEELVSEGNKILMRAVELFDYSRGNRFCTYLTHAVQRRFYRYFRSVQRMRTREISGTKQTLGTMAATVDDTPPELAPAPQDSVAQLMRHVDRCLDDREWFVVQERFGLGPSGTGRTLQSIADELGVSKERVRQLHHKALQKLRRLAGELQLDPLPV